MHSISIWEFGTKFEHFYLDLRSTSVWCCRKYVDHQIWTTTIAISEKGMTFFKIKCLRQASNAASVAWEYQSI